MSVNLLTPPAISPDQQTAAQHEAVHAPVGTPDYLGSAVLTEARPYPGSETQSAQTEDFTDEDHAMTAALANGLDVRPEDKGRVLNIEEAYEQAEQENVLRDWTAALEEDAQRTEAKLELEKVEEAKKEALKQSPAEATSEEPAAPKAVQAEQAAAADAAVKSLQEQVQALKEAGLPITLTPQTKIRKDLLNNNLIVVNGDHIQVLKPNALDGKYKVVDYRFDRGSRTLSIGGNSFIPADKYVEGTSESGSAEHGIVLPAAVADVVGFDRVVPAGAVHRDTAPQTPAR